MWLWKVGTPPPKYGFKILLEKKALKMGGVGISLIALFSKIELLLLMALAEKQRIVRYSKLTKSNFKG